MVVSKNNAQKKFDPLTWEYLAKAWGVTARTLMNKSKSTATTVEKPKVLPLSPKQQSVVDSYDAAKIVYSPSKLFIEDRVNFRLQAEPADGKCQAEGEHLYREEGRLSGYG